MSRSPQPRSRSRSPMPNAPQAGSPRDGDDAGGGLAPEDDWKNKLLDALEDHRYTRTDLDAATWDDLEEMGPQLAANVVQRMCESNLARIRNINAFTSSIIKRIKQEGPDMGRGDIRDLDPKVEDAVRACLGGDRFTEDDFDLRIVTAINDLSVDLALQAIDKFANSNLEGIRSRTGFMMAIIRRVRAGEDPRGESRGPRGFPPGAGRPPDRAYEHHGPPPMRRGSFDRYDRGPPPMRGYDRAPDRYDRAPDRYDRGPPMDRGYDRGFERYDRGPPPMERGYDRGPPMDRGYDRGPERYGGGGGGDRYDDRGGGGDRYDDRDRYRR